MPYKLISADNKEVEVNCIGCALAKGEIKAVGGNILETNSFILAQDFEVPIPGFLIIGSKRHFRGFDEFNEDESKEFTDILIKSRKTMKEALGVAEVTVIQEERSPTSHFHVWLFPWYDMMKEIGFGLDSIREIMEYAKNNLKTENNLSKVQEATEKVKKYFK